jgi:pyruvate,water dikinase
MNDVVAFDHADARVAGLAGGKGVNLARLAQAGFPVPQGFVVTTRAYASFLANGSLAHEIQRRVARIGHDDPAALEEQSAAVRQLILDTAMPSAITAAIEQAYRTLGADFHVAVRSSGTAEDLADASFAGQHDTYLDIRHAADVVDAVRRCWASLWTARAIEYRHHNGFAHDSVAIAVVVQKMVRSDVSGVMFTANPLTTATDELVINATWGLGEALVQGVVTPDQIVVQRPAAQIIEQTCGAKELKIVRDEAAGSGVSTERVPDHEREQLCLDAAMIDALVDLGARVERFYDGLPQDIEWAFESGALHLLQARPITGVEFSWDADVDAVHVQNVAADVVWTRAFGDALASGVVSPLTYSTRFPIFSARNLRRVLEILGFDDLAAMRAFKYWKGELYYNAELERRFVERFVPPPLRDMFLDFIPPVLHEAVLAAPFDSTVFLRGLMRWHLLDNDTTPAALPKTFQRWRERTDYEGLSYPALRELEDEVVIDYCERLSEIFGEWNDTMWGPGTVSLRLLMSGLRWMVGNWYDGDGRETTFPKLVAGATHRTDTQHENAELLLLVNEIRKSPRLRAALDAHADAGFFEAIAEHDDGRRFLERYAAWIDRWGHRGHADRDYIYPRRAEDRSIDVRAFRVMMNTDDSFDAAAAEEAVTREREATLAAVIANVAQQQDGARRVEILKFVYALTHAALVIRDDERARPTDVLTYARKRGYVEIGRRLHERGQIDAARDFHFLSELELFELLRNRCRNPALLQAKIRARARNCDRMLRKEANMPMHLQRNRAVEMDRPPTEGVDGMWTGTATSPGVMTGVARVIMDHSEMGRVARGEILITHSTDPGWNPVFGLISAVVTETGGLLSHASCLAREYGFPAVHLLNATQLIPDGARIEVDGHAGMVRLIDAG